MTVRLAGSCFRRLSEATGGRSRIVFFFNDTATTEIYTLSLHDALPIFTTQARCWRMSVAGDKIRCFCSSKRCRKDRKSTRLNSSHVRISYAVFCLKKKKRNFFMRLQSEHEEHVCSIVSPKGAWHSPTFL